MNIKPMPYRLDALRFQISLAAWPGLRHVSAVNKAYEASASGSLVEPLLGEIYTEHIQLVPQNMGWLDTSLVEYLKDAFPKTQFRLHANVSVMPKSVFADLSGLHLYPEWFKTAASISKQLNAPAYSAHSGSREQCSMSEMLDNARNLADLFGCPVAVEGQYPVRGDTFLVSTWSEYRELFESGVPYALDLSHLNILANRSGVYEVSLVQEMLSCERCIEVHVSDNDGTGDQHQVCNELTWWYSLLPYTHADAVIFSEGNHRRAELRHANSNAVVREREHVA